MTSKTCDRCGDSEPYLWEPEGSDVDLCIDCFVGRLTVTTERADE